ncbi:hydroxyacid dehydrogenase [Thalassorhabdomicrobium marinisediminis]|uniref:Hydroxyacid dehydrogenase n=1 Tax=Thalassorhabdomicrobium marinisediminis TaxID=2170577 RepID=A0A2T7FZC4_9RHOB|nr:hydroxyacid dehydrogenase [Thalassorhabdomicrobium marinisediminis]PVA07523.1 hydroxyacid dehydrogenase [Thalassorhabdomicrobium marinisediminis]
MSNVRKILVSGPDIATSAVHLAEEAGYELIYTPAYADAATLVELVRRHDPVGIVSRAGTLGALPIAAGRSLQVISKHGAGVDNIDVQAATRSGVQVIRATGSNAVSVAEHAVTLAMVAVKRLRSLDITLRQGKWEKMGFVGRELAGMRVGLVGAGAIAQSAAQLFRGLGLSVAAYDPFADASVFKASKMDKFADLESMLQKSDIISLHCPLTPDTRNLLNDRTIAMLPRGSYIINTARGGLVDELALLKAIDDGQIAGAGLDVFETEPLENDHPLFAASELIVTPHIGASTAEAMERVGKDAVQGIIDLVEERAIAADRIVNKIDQHV